jgi:hypothetical protein
MCEKSHSCLRYLLMEEELELFKVTYVCKEVCSEKNTFIVAILVFL